MPFLKHNNNIMQKWQTEQLLKDEFNQEATQLEKSEWRKNPRYFRSGVSIMYARGWEVPCRGNEDGVVQILNIMGSGDSAELIAGSVHYRCINRPTGPPARSGPHPTSRWIRMQDSPEEKAQTPLMHERRTEWSKCGKLWPSGEKIHKSIWKKTQLYTARSPSM